MKKSAWFLLGTLIMWAAFGLALAGCPTEGGGGDPAAQLAEEINAMEPDSATVDGAVVTLSEYLSLESQFTVPAGVTLDLTGDGELALLDGTLTVNGTVKAGSNKIHMRTAASQAAINGSGTIQLKGKGRLLNVGRSEDGPNKTLTLDGVTLVGVPDNYESLVGVDGGGAFVMKSGKITGNTRVGDDWAGGGGVNIVEGGTFTMQGGEISGNTVKGSNSYGGGVNIAEGGAFTMQGGAVSGNTVESGGDYSEGGGVAAWRGAFIMQGGEISGNTAKRSGGGSGGGVHIGESTFTMEGGEIFGNTAESDGSWSAGGGVSMWDSTFTMKGGTIYGKSDRLSAGDVSLANSAIYNSALDVSGDTAAAKWGTGGAYTKGGDPQTGGTNIDSTDDTLIAVPGK